jgi:glutamate racemase
VSATPSLPNPYGPIGVFDSGVGGLSVLRALLARLPDESYLYVADSANCPYGPRGHLEILRLSEGIARYLIAGGAKAVVVACNTASAAALAHLRTSFPQTPFVGMVPAVKPATQATRRGVVGVLATPATFGGRLYEEVVEHYADGIRVMSVACPGLVEQVEEGDLDGPETVALLRRCLMPLLDAGADTIVLGCTHYPFLAPAIRALVGEGVQVLETGEAVARQTARVLAERRLQATGGIEPTCLCATTGDAARLTQAVSQLLGRQAEVRALRWQEGTLRSLFTALRPSTS